MGYSYRLLQSQKGQALFLFIIGTKMKHLNRKQIIVVTFSLIILSIMLLFPPYGYIISIQGDEFAGYRWIFSEKAIDGKGIFINYFVQGKQISLLVILSAIAILICRNKKKNNV